MLTGQYAHTLDAKGRVNFPARLREELGPRFFITRGLDNCLFVYSPEEWQALADKLSKLPMSKSTPLSRFFFAGAAEVEPDKQGRISGAFAQICRLRKRNYHCRRFQPG